MKRWIILGSLLVVGCSTPAERSARNFVRWDALSDDKNAAAERCTGRYTLIAGKKRYGADDYECVVEANSLTRASHDVSKRLPTAEDVAQIETGFLLLSNMTIVGVADTESMNRMSRVQVRDVVCRFVTGQGPVCTYSADACLENEADLDGDGWCFRESRLVRTTGLSPSMPLSSSGWTIDRVPAHK